MRMVIGRIVRVSLFDEDIERPQRAGRNRIAGRAISDHPAPGRIFENRLRASYIVAKRSVGLVVDEPMRVAVRRNLMAPAGDCLDEFPMPLADPPENEEGAVDFEFVEQIEQPLRVPYHAALHRAPLRPRHDSVEDTDVEVVLDVDAHRIDDHVRLPFAAIRS